MNSSQESRIRWCLEKIVSVFGNPNLKTLLESCAKDVISLPQLRQWVLESWKTGLFTKIPPMLQKNERSDFWLIASRVVQRCDLQATAEQNQEQRPGRKDKETEQEVQIVHRRIKIADPNSADTCQCPVVFEQAVFNQPVATSVQQEHLMQRQALPSRISRDSLHIHVQMNLQEPLCQLESKGNEQMEPSISHSNNANQAEIVGVIQTEQEVQMNIGLGGRSQPIPFEFFPCKIELYDAGD